MPDPTRTGFIPKWLRDQPLDLPAWKLAVIGLCFVGAVLVVFEVERPPSTQQPKVVAADETSPGPESRATPGTSGSLQAGPADAKSCTCPGGPCAPSLVNAAIALQPLVEHQRASPSGLPVRGGQTEVAE